MSRHADPRVARVIQFFESLQPADVARLGQHYSEHCLFKDPFNEVRGVAATQGVFRHMFEALHQPRFVVHEAVAQGDQCFLTWDFLFEFRRHVAGPQVVRGASHLRFDAEGRVVLHRDYWDAAEELYEKLPLVKLLMRWLKRRAST